MRSAITRHTVPGSCLFGAAAPFPRAGAAAASTSAATTAPFGPLPASASIAIPRACARRRAFGEASGRPVRRGGGSIPAGDAATASTSRTSLGSVAAKTGASSPAATTTATTSPTGTSSPSCARTPASVPSAGASISTVTLSVSTSISGSPFTTGSPSDFSQRRILPVSCAMPSAGMITSAGMRPFELCGGDDAVDDARVVEVRRHLALAGQRPGDGVLAAGGHEQLLGREARDHLAPVLRDDELLLDPRRRPAVRRGPEHLEGEDHALLDRLRIVEGDEAREDRLLPDRETDAVSVLERERGLLVREAELLRPREHLDDLGGRHARPDHRDRLVEVVAAARVGIDERARRRADRERAVVARAVAVVGVEDVEVRGVARAQHPVGEDVRVRRAALARDRVHAFDVLRAELEEHLVHERDAVVLAEARAHRAVELVVGRVDHRARGVQKRDLVLRLDLPDVLHERLAVDDGDARVLQRLQHRQLDHVDTDGLAEQAALCELDADLLRHRFRAALDGAAERGDAGARAVLAEPRAIELVVSRGGAEVPHDRLLVAHEEREADQLVHRPR